MNPKRKIYLMMKNVPGLSALTNIAMKLNLTVQKYYHVKILIFNDILTQN